LLFLGICNIRIYVHCEASVVIVRLAVPPFIGNEMSLVRITLSNDTLSFSHFSQPRSITKLNNTIMLGICFMIIS
jgi:hypothetical protein